MCDHILFDLGKKLKETKVFFDKMIILHHLNLNII